MGLYKRFISATNCCAWTAILTVAIAGCVAQTNLVDPDKSDPKADVEKYGIQVESIRLTGADHFVDFRFRVIDSQKAGSLLDRKDSAYLLHEPSGKAFSVPVTKVGPLRASAVDPKAGRTYVILFANSNKIIQSGDPVTVAIGDYRSSGLFIGMAREEASLSPEQEASWKNVQRDLLRAYNECASGCGHDPTCQRQCRDGYETELGNAYVEMMKR